MILMLIIAAAVGAAGASVWRRRMRVDITPLALRTYAYETPIFSDRKLPPGLGLRLDDAIGCVSTAGERRRLWTRQEFDRWAHDMLAFTVVTGAHASLAAKDGVTIYMPEEPDSYALSPTGITAAIARAFVGDVPLSAGFLLAVEEARAALQAREE